MNRSRESCVRRSELYSMQKLLQKLKNGNLHVLPFDFFVDFSHKEKM